MIQYGKVRADDDYVDKWQASMQRALNFSESWCRAEDLFIIPENTELVTFTKRNKR
jgi:hypothetical protein